MDGKKDPGRFTVRFNIADPRQREVIDLLNRQGRFKAQFLANAVQHYVHCNEAPSSHPASLADAGQIERIVRNVLAAQQASQAVGPEKQIDSNQDNPLHGTDKDVIFRTLEAFQQQ